MCVRWGGRFFLLLGSDEKGARGGEGGGSTYIYTLSKSE